MLCIYADYKSDESYTPSKISVRVGNNFHNLQEIRVRSLVNIAILTLLGTILSTLYSLLVSAAVGDG